MSEGHSMIIAIIIATILSIFSAAAAGDLQPAVRGDQRVTVEAPPPPSRWPSSFRAFDCAWVEAELVARDVKPRVVAFLVPTAEGESHCCPFIQGQDRTDADCNVTHIASPPPHHRGDTGLFMINVVHYKTTRGLACPKYTCVQDVLRLDIGMQFDVMLELYAKCGVKPWDAPYYGCSPDWPFNYPESEAL
jgi:hypothetical protein